MSKTTDLIQKAERFGAANYHPLPVVISKGLGSHVWDVEGKKYLDFLSSYSAVNFGHGHPELLAALRQQCERLSVCSRAFHSEELSLLLEDLCTFTQFEKALLMNSGAEAVETAVKIARKWGYEKKKVKAGTAEIIAMKNNFHGRTLSMISLSSEPHYRKNFDPFTPGFTLVDFGSLEAVAGHLTPNTVAVLLEPIQAEAGILLPPQGYIKALRNLCQKNNVLLMLDEIQTGLGRTGKNFCFEYEEAKPDVLILGKSLGGGLVPISAVLTSTAVMEVMQPGTHGSTFGGNPLACAVARQGLTILKRDNLAARAAQIGEKTIHFLAESFLPMVRAIRGKGALIGIDIDPAVASARSFCERLAVAGVLAKETHETVIRIAPPLIITDAELEEGLEKVVATLSTPA